MSENRQSVNNACSGSGQPTNIVRHKRPKLTEFLCPVCGREAGAKLDLSDVISGQGWITSDHFVKEQVNG